MTDFTDALCDHLVFATTVTRVTDLSPSLRRVTVTGADLAHFGTGGPSLDLRIKLALPATPGGPLSPELLALRPGMPAPADHTGWYRRWLASDPAVRGYLRTYTVREFRPDAAGHPELDIDIVLHGGDSSGPGASFGEHAQVGDTLAIFGPNRRLATPAYRGIEFRPGSANELLLIGDETALPAIAAILESLPAPVRGTALIEVGEQRDRLPLTTPSSVDVTWLVRGSEFARGELLDRAIRGLDLARFAAPGEHAEPEDVNVDDVILWETDTSEQDAFYAWIAGEAGCVKQLRRYLVREVGIDRRQIAFMGYWRLGKAES
ncbi:siderophore-interacting protein [Bowdeniella massiliensis]|uniref:siderophore-interacting protein n=1 Tax=Bowdeniella massiliensis TaxID=2932264 RepID=UPI0020279FA1|nr:siderophore-interacting protein [Bowdeniella massiliensis]